MTALKLSEGSRVGRWTLESRISGAWVCLCDCGSRKSVNVQSLRAATSRSCGCLRSERVAQRLRTHGASGSRLYSIWRLMKARCYRESCTDYPRYGGRGITVQSEWRDSFEAFAAAVGDRPSPAHSLERVDNNLGYQEGNVTWATKVEQAANTRITKLWNLNGESRTLRQWALHHSIQPNTLRDRVGRQGLSLEEALNKVAN